MARPFEFDKDLVLDKAMLLFWNKGYFDTSFQDIVQHLELNRSSIYNSFTDKRTLFIESRKNYINKESISMMESLSKLPPEKNSIKKILEQVVSANFTNKNPKGCLVVNTAIEIANHDTYIKDIIANNAQEVIAAFTDFIKEGQKQGNFNTKIKADALAIALFHQITALRVTGKIITNKSFFSNTINTFIQLFNKT
ncbi:MAG: TetR/AcrR family transcriptional regulator [Bacteroidetes bacterium]|nr:TetR/AcrR family transcriptional regulator [Bacteroidota bacterium]